MTNEHQRVQPSNGINNAKHTHDSVADLDTGENLVYVPTRVMPQK